MHNAGLGGGNGMAAGEEEREQGEKFEERRIGVETPRKET